MNESHLTRLHWIKLNMYFHTKNVANTNAFEYIPNGVPFTSKIDPVMPLIGLISMN